ncbi:DUF1997 domain-containing protein [Oscillatoria sp. FACHB-1407]|uniref:DUF1997 domain-containing protein n=1 Tax=Oscillatoria sp. FACHB-1407 TaxID=2692847 RepID=UPI001688D92D|nr:DUF1997 domain-containing protein [Oscillatoria sp. FACHB-1407]MBD2465313.1 DUF1997 domain-containing protein [Oscillatoria sp. FACHB-1407]
MSIRFTASQSVELVVPEQPIPIQHYLRQPQRLIRALVDPSRMEQLSADSFRLKMRPLSFMMLSLQPVVDMRVRSEANGTIHLESIGCEIRGIEYINQRFKLNLVGKLNPVVINHTTHLCGRADLEVQVDLPPAFMMTPKPILEATGNGLLRSVLLTIKQRLMHQLLVDYRKWVAQTVSAEEERSPMLPTNSPII